MRSCFAGVTQQTRDERSGVDCTVFAQLGPSLGSVVLQFARPLCAMITLNQIIYQMQLQISDTLDMCPHTQRHTHGHQPLDSLRPCMVNTVVDGIIKNLRTGLKQASLISMNLLISPAGWRYQLQS
jgi:hypothetical protein